MTEKNLSMHTLTRRQRGFSLIEALVAFLLLSVGMLGIASLQAVSLRAGYTATLRTVAVIKAEEILERMRANQTALASYVSVAGAGTAAPVPECTDISGVVICNPAQMASYDIYKWKQDLLGSFPANTTATIAVTAPVDPNVQPLSIVTVAINWDERDPSADGQVIKMNYSTSQDICGAAAC